MPPKKIYRKIKIFPFLYGDINIVNLFYYYLKPIIPRPFACKGGEVRSGVIKYGNIYSKFLGVKA